MTEHEVMSQPDLHERWAGNPVFRLFVGLLCLFCVSNLLLAIRTDNFRHPNTFEFLLVGLATGMLGAQTALHAIWTVFCTWKWTHRVLISVVSALVLCLAYLGNLLIGPGRQDQIVVTQVLLCMPLSLFAIQAPLWGLKAGWRWGVFRSGAGSDCTQIRALSIQDLLLATMAIAVAIALTQFAMTIDGRTIDSGMAMVMFVVPLVAAFVSLLTTVTSLLATLRAQDMVSGVRMVTTIEAAIYFGWFALVCHLEGVPPGEIVTMFIGVFFGFTISLNAPLCYLRRCGYRLRRADVDLTQEGPLAN
jgi:hypothetical protein